MFVQVLVAATALLEAISTMIAMEEQLFYCDVIELFSKNYVKINDKDRRSDEIAKSIIFDGVRVWVDGRSSRDWISIYPLLSLLLLTYVLVRSSLSFC